MRAPQPAAISSRMLRVAVATFLLAAAACTNDPVNPTMPSGPSFVGTWVGPVKPAAVAGNLQITLESLVPISSTPGACAMALSGTLDSTLTRIDGSMSPMSCSGGASTPVTLSKQ